MSVATPTTLPPGASAPQNPSPRQDFDINITPDEEDPMLMDMDSAIDDISVTFSDDDMPSDSESEDMHSFTKKHHEEAAPPYYDALEDMHDEDYLGGENPFDQRSPDPDSLDWESAQPVKTDGPLIQKINVGSVTQLPATSNPGQDDFRPMSSSSRNARASGSRSPASWAGAVTSRSGPTTPLCVVCGKKPAYTDDRRSYPTCSKTCGVHLQAMRGLPVQKSGGSSSLSSYDLRSGPRSVWQMHQDIRNSHHRSTPTVRMCVVCKTRPQHVRGGQTYPTCGLTCASKLAGSQGVEMCTFCHQRPKAVRNGKTYPQCGKTCRDKAQAQAVTSVATCTTCILCWKRFKAGNNDFCTPDCISNAERRSPMLLEIPKGHVSFKKVSDCFVRSWKSDLTNVPCPSVKKIYMVSVKRTARNNYELYRNKVSQYGVFPKKGNEMLSWLGIPRDCGFGDPGKMEPCASPKCLLCCIVRSTFTKVDFPDGIMTTPLPRAVELVGDPPRQSSKVVMVANILMGRKIEVDSRDMVQPMPPQGSDSVHIIGMNPRGKIDYGEIVLYNSDAVRPLYLIAYE